MNNKGSCLTFNSLINLFPKVNDVLHCDFSIRQLHTLEFFSLAFLRKPFSFPFHLTNYLPILAVVLASVWWGLGLRARIGKVKASAADLPLLFSFRRDNVGLWKKKRKRIALFFFFLKENVVL